MALAVLLLAGCGGGPALAPEILYGEDICDRCRMVISERRHAAAARVEGSELRFDDPGCLVELLAERPETAAGELWVHDESGSWLPAAAAWFALDPERGTPMASGLMAFSDAQTATAAASGWGTRALSWPEVAASRAETAPLPE